MRAAEFYRAVTIDHADLLDRLLALFEREHIRYCIIDGLAVNAYVEPLVSLDLDVVVASEDLGRVERLLAEEFAIAEFPHSLNVSDPDSSLRVQIQKDARYAAFVARSESRDVLGRAMRVASVADVLQEERSGLPAIRSGGKASERKTCSISRESSRRTRTFENEYLIRSCS